MSPSIIPSFLYPELSRRNYTESIRNEGLQIVYCRIVHIVQLTKVYKHATMKMYTHVNVYRKDDYMKSEIPIHDARLRMLLTPKQYTYYQQHIIEGRSMTAIAEDAGVTRAAVSKSLQDARRRVLRYLEGGVKK